MQLRDSTSPQPSEFRPALPLTVVIHSLLCSYFSQPDLLPRKIFLPLIGRGKPRRSLTHPQPTHTQEPWPGSRQATSTRNHSIPSDQSALRTLPRQPIQANTRCPGQLRPQALRSHPASGRALGWGIRPSSPEGLGAFQLAASSGGPSPIGCRQPRGAGKPEEL